MTKTRYTITAARSEMIPGGYYGLVHDNEENRTVFSTAVKQGKNARKRALAAAKNREE